MRVALLSPAKRRYAALIAGIGVGIIGLVLICLALSEKLFLSMFVGDLVYLVQSAPISQDTMHVMNSLIANGRVSYLSMATKFLMGFFGVIFIYLGVMLGLTYRSSDYSLRHLFTKDYWIKFNAFKYRKTKIKLRA